MKWRAQRWMLNAEIVAAYRDRYGIVSPTRALGRRAQDHDDPIERLDGSARPRLSSVRAASLASPCRA